MISCVFAHQSGNDERRQRIIFLPRTINTIFDQRKKLRQNNDPIDVYYSFKILKCIIFYHWIEKKRNGEGQRNECKK